MLQVFSRRQTGLLEQWREQGWLEVATPVAADVLGQIIDNPLIARETIGALDLGGPSLEVVAETDEKVMVSWQREQCVRVWREGDIMPRSSSTK